MLTAVGGAPRSVPGPFALVSGARNRVVVRRGDLTVEFQRLGAREAVREFRAGRLDEAPVPLGDVKALQDTLGAVVKTRTLLGLDLVTLRGIGVGLRRAYWQTANRGDYEQLVSEQDGSAAYGLVGLGREGSRARSGTLWIRSPRCRACPCELASSRIRRCATPPACCTRSGATSASVPGS